MRREPVGDRWFVALIGVLALAAGAGLGAAVGGGYGGIVGVAPGAALVALLVRSHSRRRSRRSRALARPFPQAWRSRLKRAYDHYERLPASLRTLFEDDLRIFLAEKRITGVGVDVDDGLRLLVGASAVTLSLGWPAYEWDQLAEVLLYPDDFDRDYNIGRADLAGQAHPWGTVILSVPALLGSFEDPDDSYHVGLHEFAHLLDVAQARFDGIPPGLDDGWTRRFVALRESEMERMRKGLSILDSYGAYDPVEFLAVAIEAFFETPVVLRRRQRELYELLASYFAQDPAAWDDARGRRR
jgi:Mlc titration factor MtfA (ptsG expression regulator)